MPLFHLFLDVEESEGVRKIAAAKGRTWGIKFKCTNCRDVSERFVDVDPSEHREASGGGMHNCIVKCQFCSSIITATVITDGTAPLVLEDGKEAESANNGHVLTLDVRNGEPEELMLDAQWVAVSEGGKTFEDVDLSDDWVEYDEDNSASLSIMGASVRVVKPKKSK